MNFVFFKYEPNRAALHKAGMAGVMICCSALGFLLVGCNSDLIERIDRLEAELREVRSDTRDEVQELKGRIISTETTIGISQDPRSFNARLTQLEGSLAEASLRQTGGNQLAYLRTNLQGHTPIDTDHGTFLVRMEGMDLNLESGGYNVHLNIGNPLAVAVEQFTLKGDFGGGTPELEEGEEYSLDNPRIRAWQETLTPFEYRVTKTLEPFSWTPFDVLIEADTREDLEMIRFSMTIENARLKRQDSEGGGENSYAHIRVEAKGASVLRTSYGAFLITIKKTETTDLGTRVHLEIGNPYGFTLDQARLIGEHGPKLPQRQDSASSEEYNEKMKVWGASLKPFEALIPDKISNFRWNRTSVLIPGKEDQVQFLRCQLRIEDVTLPAATDKN